MGLFGSIAKVFEKVKEEVKRDTSKVKGAVHKATNQFDSVTGMNIGGHNKGGWLNATSGMETLGDVLNGHWKDVGEDLTDWRDKAGLGFENKPPEAPEQKVASTGALGDSVNNQAEQASQLNKGTALGAGKAAAEKDMAEARARAGRNMGTIAQDEKGNADSSLMNKLKKMGNKSTFSNDFIK